MPTITGDNALEWKMKEMARRAGKKFEPEQPSNPFTGLSKEELKAQNKLIKEAKKEAKKAGKEQ
jgi:hypothetical protein